MKMERGDVVVETFPIGTFACNCSLIYHRQSKEAIVVDGGNDYPTLKKKLDERGLKVKKMLHTHAHFDHIGASGICAKATGAKLYLHAEDLFLYQALEQQGEIFRQEVGPSIPIDEYLQEDMSFGLEGEGLAEFMSTIHTPGHTPGSCCFYSEYFEVPLLFAGDTMFQFSIGRTDLPGGDSEAILKSIKTRLLTLPDETEVVTGHGPKTRIQLEKKANPFIR